MKLYFIMFCTCISLTATAQTNNTKALDIKNGNINIGKIIINPVTNTQVYLAAITQQDSMGFYITKYKFVSKAQQAGFHFSLSLTFNQSLIRTGAGYFNLSGDENSTVNSTAAYDEQTNTITAKGSTNSDALTLSVTSHNPLYSSITGTAGKTF